jgi:hypothetical protein
MVYSDSARLHSNFMYLTDSVFTQMTVILGIIGQEIEALRNISLDMAN